MKNSIFNAVCKTRYLALLVVLILTCGNVWGADTELTFTLSSNPGGWPTSGSAGNYTYTIDGNTYTFALGTNVYCNSGYLMLKSTTSLGLPAISGKKLTKVVVSNSSGCSTSTKVGISSSSSSASYISGGAIQTYSTTSSTYTYNLTGTSDNTVYYLYVTNKNCQITKLELTYSGGSTPTVTVSDNATSLAMGDAKVNGSGVTNSTLSFSGANLTANATLSISGTNAAMFSVSPTNVSKGSGTITNQTITVTYSPTSAGSHSATLTISSTGATSKTIALSGTGKYEVTWKCAGSDDVTTLVASGSRPTFPSTPTSCDTGEGASTSFYGWSTSTWSDKINNISAKTIYTSASSMPTVIGNGVVYHAVFCKGGAGSEVLNEEFDNTSSSDASTAITTSTFSNFSGTTSKAYKSKYGGIKLGSSSSSGYITSKSLDLSKAFTVSIDACKYGSDGGNINVTVGSTTKTISNSELGAAGTFNTYELSFDAATSTSTVKIETSSLRAYIDNVVITTRGAASNFLTNCCTQLGTINGSNCRT